MTKRKVQAKTPQQLADEHWDWIEGIILTQMRLTMRLFKDGFIHGYKHGDGRNKEIVHEGIRTITIKK